MSIFASSLPKSIIKRLTLKVKEVEGINLGQGIPSFPTAPHIIAAATAALREADIGVYPNFLGNIELRQQISKKLNSTHKIQLDEKNILITVGAMEATATAILSIVEANDTVGIVTPDYCNHFPQVQLARGKIVEIASSLETGIDFHGLELAAQSGMKLLLFTNPSNPTGYVWKKKELEKLLQIAKKYGFWILSDETYYFLTYETPQISLLDFWQVYERLIVARSFSKEYAMTGWRVGYIVAQKSEIELFSRTHDALVGCVPKISQSAALAAITGSQEIVADYKKTYRRRRDYVVETLGPVSPKLSEFPPQGAYYLFLKYGQKISSIEIANEILAKTKVGVVPGIAFGLAGEGHVRISYAVEDLVLEKSIPLLKDFFLDLKKRA